MADPYARRVSSLLFEFVQFEFTYSIGPHEGRYVVQSNGASGEEGPEARGRYEDSNRTVTGTTTQLGAADVLVIGIVDAKGASRRALRKKVELAEPGEAPEEVSLLLATFVKGTSPMRDERQAKSRLEAVSIDPEAQQARIEESLAVLNRAIRAYRAGAHDPYVVEVSRRNARTIRMGYGDSDDVANNRWRRAIEVPRPNAPRAKRVDRLRPSETTARVMSGRSEVLESEELLLRCMADLDHGRTRAAAMQAYGALELLRHELPDPQYANMGDHAGSAQSERAQKVASAATRGPLGPDELAELDELIEFAEGKIERWRYEDTPSD